MIDLKPFGMFGRGQERAPGRCFDTETFKGAPSNLAKTDGVFSDRLRRKLALHDATSAQFAPGFVLAVVFTVVMM